MCGQNNNNGCCLASVLETILTLQQNSECDDRPEGCNRPFLGHQRKENLNTRPFNLYSCCNNVLLKFPFTLNGVTCESSVFRIENLNDCCATCRVLAPNPDCEDRENPYVATEDFFTINLNCVCTLKCLEDTNVCGV